MEVRIRTLHCSGSAVVTLIRWRESASQQDYTAKVENQKMSISPSPTANPSQSQGEGKLPPLSHTVLGVSRCKWLHFKQRLADSPNPIYATGKLDRAASFCGCLNTAVARLKLHTTCDRCQVVAHTKFNAGFRSGCRWRTSML